LKTHKLEKNFQSLKNKPELIWVGTAYKTPEGGFALKKKVGEPTP
jgi:hypothetical protein